MDKRQMHIDDALFIGEVFRELERAREKFPSSKFVMTALTEEVGELAQAILKVAAGKWTKDRIWKEAFQVAAMAVRVAVEGDTSFENADYKEPEQHDSSNNPCPECKKERNFRDEGHGWSNRVQWSDDD